MAPPGTTPAAPEAQPVESLPGIGPKRAALLANLGITTVRGLLRHLPRDYDDRRRVAPISSLREDQRATVQGTVLSARPVRLRRRLTLAEVVIEDASGRIKAIWFGRDFLARALRPGMRLLLTGAMGKWNGLALRNPEYEVLADDEDDRLNTGRVVPIYRLTEGITQRMLRRWIWDALSQDRPAFAEILPEAIRERHGFLAVNDAIQAVHFPKTIEQGRGARSRFAYEELLAIQIGVLRARALRHNEEIGNCHVTNGAMLVRLRESLPFELTSGQERAVTDILQDMASPRPMLRLLQGDVGCGKTVVALHAIAAAADGGYQTAVMAPTEILAEQHGLSLRALLDPLGIEVAVLTGSTPSAGELRDRIAAGACPVVVGTHALIQESTQFHKLGLAVIDEQHRFGVFQRSALGEKGLNPDILHMTATPIPRTLAITVYGGMDVSVIEELPPRRHPVKTSRVTPAKLEDLYKRIRKRAGQGQRTFIICPLVEESTKRALTAVTKHFESLSAEAFSDLRTGLLHGRMAGPAKDEVMRAFQRGDIDVLFSTTVVEVGVDCPAATTMVIEDASQFGLTQLHQLRGRVGRGAEQAYCYLLGKPKTPDGKQRLAVMCETTNGFEIAEADLALRGPGEFYGVRQAGLSDLRAADLIRDVRLLDAARRDAEGLLEEDPGLERDDLRPLARAAARFAQVVA